MSQPTTTRDSSYMTAVHMLSDPRVKEDVDDACRKLTHSMSQSVQAFESIAKQFHTIDMQRISSPFKPRWDAVSKAYVELLPCYRANASYISGRLKLFCSAVLPVSTRRVDQPQQSKEPSQVLQSFISITSEHVKHTQALLERSVALTREMVSLHIELAQASCQQFSSGQKEVLELATKSSEMDVQVRYLCSLNMALDMEDPMYPVFSAFRLAKQFGNKPSRSRLTTQALALPQSLQRISEAVGTLDAKRNEFAYMQYSAQIKSPPDHYLARAQASLSALIDKSLRHFEASLVLFMSIWARLRTDCRFLAQWMRDPGVECSLVLSYQQSGNAIYAPFVALMEAYASGFELLAPAQAG